jgi:PhnB protein
MKKSSRSSASKKKATNRAKRPAKKAAAKKRVEAVPTGYRTITPYIVCRDAANAIDFYKKAFGAKEKSRMPGPGGKVMHAELRVGDSMVMLCDEMPEMGTRSPLSLGGSPASIFLYVKNVDAIADKATAAGATVVMPVQDMFWGDRYGKLKDPYGHEWQIATHKEDLTPKQRAKRAQAAMSQGLAT